MRPLSFKIILLPLSALLLLLVGVFGYITSQPLSFGQALIQIHQQQFAVEVAQSHKQREQGLMYRTEMGANHGMLFVFPRPVEAKFWMKNTRIPLDILFFDRNHKFINGAYRAQPCTEDPCPHYYSNDKAKYVLELNEGEGEKLQLKRGDLFEIKNVRSD